MPPSYTTNKGGDRGGAAPSAWRWNLARSQAWRSDADHAQRQMAGSRAGRGAADQTGRSRSFGGSSGSVRHRKCSTASRPTIRRTDSRIRSATCSASSALLNRRSIETSCSRATRSACPKAARMDTRSVRRRSGLRRAPSRSRSSALRGARRSPRTGGRGAGRGSRRTRGPLPRATPGGGRPGRRRRSR
jgi:hypothetical protein